MIKTGNCYGQNLFENDAFLLRRGMHTLIITMLCYEISPLLSLSGLCIIHAIFSNSFQLIHFLKDNHLCL